MKARRIWVLIADGSRARILEQIGKGAPLSEVAGSRIETHVPPSRDIVSDKQGSTMVSGGARRHAYTPHTDPHREAKRDFLQGIAARLEKDVAADAFDDLVLVAPPQALGDLRSALSPHVASRVVREVTKDLTKVPDHEIPDHLDFPDRT
jgi:protein required for attachment to host cells